MEVAGDVTAERLLEGDDSKHGKKRESEIKDESLEPVSKFAKHEENSTTNSQNQVQMKETKFEEDHSLAASGGSEGNKVHEGEMKFAEGKEYCGTAVVDENDSSGNKALDPLGYTKAAEFTSEIFKVQIHNLPKFGFSQLKKRLINLGLKPHKLKSPKQQVTYVCFRNEADRREAIEKINGHVWKGRTLEAKEAAPVVDPFIHKKQQQQGQDQLSSGTDSMVSAKDEPLSEEEAHKRLKDNVVPLWNMDYSQQLENKTEKIKAVLKKMTHNQFVRDQFRRLESWKVDGLACPVLPIVPSPVTAEYRNKNEFTVGFTADGKTIRVGFRYGMYKDGTTTVGDCTGLGVVKPAAIPIIQSFEKFVSSSIWLPFLQQTGTGHWHTLTLRTFDSGDVMAMVDFHHRNLDKTEIEAAKNTLKEFYSTGEGSSVGIKSFYFRLYSRAPGGMDRLQHILGDKFVYEQLLGLKFRISPEAFFQINTKATEKLYSLIADWCEVSQSTILLDICCGTGTIGLSMAKRVRHVIGVEMCKPAVEDARVNAELNGITNVKYHCSKIEDVIAQILTSIYSTTSLSSSPPTTTAALESSETGQSQNEIDVVAVVDPPRAGLHKNVIKSLRKCDDIQRLVYVSCNPESAMENFVDLIRPSTGKHKGDPFTLERAVPVDMFPGTRHCELVLLFTRSHSSPAPCTDDMDTGKLLQGAEAVHVTTATNETASAKISITTSQE